MNIKQQIKPISQDFDFSRVPSRRSADMLNASYTFLFILSCHIIMVGLLFAGKYTNIFSIHQNISKKIKRTAFYAKFQTLIDI